MSVMGPDSMIAGSGQSSKSEGSRLSPICTHGDGGAPASRACNRPPPWAPRAARTRPLRPAPRHRWPRQRPGGVFFLDHVEVVRGPPERGLGPQPPATSTSSPTHHRERVIPGGCPQPSTTVIFFFWNWRRERPTGGYARLVVGAGASGVRPGAGRRGRAAGARAGRAGAGGAGAGGGGGGPRGGEGAGGLRAAAGPGAPGAGATGAAARWWLGHARARLESDPGALSSADRARLLDALSGLADGPLRGAGAH